MRASSSPTTLRIPDEVRTCLETAWLSRGGQEPCGVLLGHQGEAGALDVARVLQLPNMHETPDRAWALDAVALAALQREVRASGHGVVGYWHGHLLGGPSPGVQDWEGRDLLGPALHLILGRGSERALEMRAWWAGAEGFRAVPIGSTCPSPLP